VKRIGLARIASIGFLIITIGINVLGNQNPCGSQKNDLIDQFEPNIFDFGEKNSTSTLNYVS